MEQKSHFWSWRDASPRLGFVGLGNMGAALAMQLVDQPLSVFDTDLKKSEIFVKSDVKVVESLEELAANSDIIFYLSSNIGQYRNGVIWAEWSCTALVIK